MVRLAREAALCLPDSRPLQTGPATASLNTPIVLHPQCRAALLAGLARLRRLQAAKRERQVPQHRRDLATGPAEPPASTPAAISLASR
jgi:hypothetical protein